MGRKIANWRKYRNDLLVVAFLIICSIILLFPPKIPLLGRYDLYNYTIWIDPNLQGEEREIIIAHEEAHRDFYRTLPFFVWLNTIPGPLFMIVILLGFLLRDNRIIICAPLLIIPRVIAELHAESVTLLKFGAHPLILDSFFTCLLVLLILLLVMAPTIYNSYRKRKKPKGD